MKITRPYKGVRVIDLKDDKPDYMAIFESMETQRRVKARLSKELKATKKQRKEAKKAADILMETLKQEYGY